MLKKTKQHLSKKTIFLTGASGVVGQALLEKLSDHTIICLTHRTPLTAPNIISLQGDITKRWFGLNRDEFKHLAQHIDYIVHAAAIIDFLQSDEAIFRTNIDGMHNILELGEVAQVGLFHISTAFVHPSAQIVEGDASYAYLYSKKEGERLIRESGLSHTILRPSIIAGDSQTGAIAKFQGLHLIIGLLVTGVLPVLPVTPQYYVDFVPQDLVANAVAELINRDRIGKEWWLTMGECAVSVQGVVDLCIEHAYRLIGHPVAPPRVVDADVFERLIRPAFMPALPRRLRRTMISALALTKACTAQPLPTSLPELENQFGLSLPLSTEQILLRNLEYWTAREGYSSRQTELERTKVFN